MTMIRLQNLDVGKILESIYRNDNKCFRLEENIIFYNFRSLALLDPLIPL